jgi:hypothetical protein
MSVSVVGVQTVVARLLDADEADERQRGRDGVVVPV